MSMSKQTMSDHQLLANKFARARSNLLIVVAMTAINLILLVAQSDTYFLFSAYIPYLLVAIGMYEGGMYPAEFYQDDLGTLQEADPSVFTVMLIVAIIAVLLYVLCWIFSKKNRVGWLIFALALFGLDTAGMLFLGGIALESIVDVIFHGWVIVSLILGVIAGCKLKKLPPEEAVVIDGEDPIEPVADAFLPNSTTLRLADPDVKARVLLESHEYGHTIVYRRVKRVNELVVDGHVYDEYEALVEMSHSLTAQIDGQQIEVGFDGQRSYLKINGEMVAKKLRLY